ncbi:MAG TPA: DivIVA domain-containing protein [Propionibacterium sp.]|nr:DivIVA domain-containing protein [Propionibacterium sp.]
MEWILWGLVVVVLALAAIAGAGRFGAMPPPVHDAPVVHLPAGTLTGEDLRRVQFALVPRGYSVAQVDELLGRVADQLDGGRPGPASEADSPRLGQSAIMDPSEFSQSGREGEHGSNEAPHG